MKRNNIVCFDESTVFRSISRDYITFEQVYEEIINFIKFDPDSSYRVSVGTDSQVGRNTVFVSCVHIHRIGRGAIGFLHKTQMERPVRSLREKIYLETLASMQLAYLFEKEKMDRIYEIVESKGKSRGVYFEFHIDIGEKGQTRSLINEMVGMVKGLNFTPKIKPESYCASSFADRYTRAI